MNENEIINLAIKELKSSDKIYKQFKDFSFMESLDATDSDFKKISYLLKRSIAFEKHTDHAIRLSSIGLDIANNHKDWFEYKKSLKPKKDYVKLIGVIIAALSLIWNIFLGISNNKLKDDIRILGDEKEALEKENASLRKNSGVK